MVRRRPLRTCIACREKKPKRELVRLVRTPDGHVLVDASGKQAGRGAYLCAKASCWHRALESGTLGRALKVRVTERDLEHLKKYARGLGEE